jgi:hypothetical protein
MPEGGGGGLLTVEDGGTVSHLGSPEAVVVGPVADDVLAGMLRPSCVSEV